jgi:multidrug resistance efflux pump
VREGLKEGDLSASRVRRAGNVDSYLLDIMGQVDRIESKMKRTRRQVEELVADAAHGHITVERVKSLGGGLAQEQAQLETELDAAQQRLQAQQSEADRRRHLGEVRDRLTREWEALAFVDLQSGLREVIDRVEVDGEELKLFLRL